jgi:hypothetical protein
MAQTLEPPRPKADAYVLSHPTLGFVVRPSFAVVSAKGDRKFRVRNLTGLDDVSVKLPLKRIVGNEGDEHKPAGKGPKDAAEFELLEIDGAFTYEVFVGNEKARGESDPVIIIDPPAN